MNVKLKALSMLGLAISLASCAAVDNQNRGAPAATTSPVVRTQTTLPSSAAGVTDSDSSANEQRDALISEINRDGRIPGFTAYRVAPPEPVQPPNQNVVALNYEQVDLRNILAELGDALDVSLVIDPSIADKVSLRTAQNRPLSYEDIWPLMTMLARENGVVLERAGNVWYARKAVTNMPIELTTPGTTGTASRVMQITPLRHISAPSAIELLTPILEPDGRISRLANSNSVLISSTPSQLARLNELLNLIDDDPFQNQGIQLYPISNASAVDVAQELTDILKLIEGTTSSYQVQGLERINALLVTAPASRGFDEINRWVRILDADRQEQAEQLFQYRVKNLKAVDLAATLTQVFTLNEDQPLITTRGVNITSAREFAETGDAAPPLLQSGATSTAVSANLKVTIVADESTNSLLIRANPRDYRQLLATIGQLDTAPLQVMINAVIAQIVLNDDTAFGVDWSRVLETASGSVTNISTSFLPRPMAGAASGLGGLLFTRSFIDGAARVDATLEAIAVNNDVRLLARPSLTVINNMEGLIRIGAEVPVRLGETITVNGTTSNIQYRPTGIELNITPRINDDGVVNLTIRQELSAVSEATGVDNNPIFENQEIETTVVVRDGENVVLGGLIQSNNGLLNTGVPFLNQVPVLGRLFSYQRDNNERRELFIVLRPEIVNVDTQNAARYQEMLSRFELAAELLQ
ncbi:MAG: type II secretion system secretin GspD [Pseudohongiella sp.]|nr:type II secretion system secretin GspD [Pseudohongiella sp.]